MAVQSWFESLKASKKTALIQDACFYAERYQDQFPVENPESGTFPTPRTSTSCQWSRLNAAASCEPQTRSELQENYYQICKEHAAH
ncbi:hypothetical protein HHUSO_G16858 [Huso huso]|uniref:Uncharacterized protein n=1 Tax=Huso huso TaxID=61971 RepID=A0ABR0ZBR0_HUSHU